MDRVLSSTTYGAPVLFYEDGVIVDPGTVTVGITREDGTTLVAAGTATSGTGAASRSFTLTTTHTASLDVLTLTWTSTLKGTLTTRLEVVGGFLFSLAEARKTGYLPSTTTYPTADVLVARTLAEAALEDACGTCFVPRYFRDRYDGTGGTDLLLPPRPLTITSVTVGATTAVTGTALTANEITDLRLYRDGRLYYSTGWTEGRQNVEVKGTRGYRQPPPRVGRAALLLAKRWLMDSPISDRATSLTNDDGTVQFFVTAGVREAITDVPECNAVIAEYSVSTGLA